MPDKAGTPDHFPSAKPGDIIVVLDMVGPEWNELLCRKIDGHWKVVDVSRPVT
jgi:hypothetical protein